MNLRTATADELLDVFAALLSAPGELTGGQMKQLKAIDAEFERREKQEVSRCEQQSFPGSAGPQPVSPIAPGERRPGARQ